MRQIIPFKKDLLFKTKVSEITSISLEHSIAIKNSEKTMAQRGGLGNAAVSHDGCRQVRATGHSL